MAKCGRNSETTRLIAALHDHGEALATTLAAALQRTTRTTHPRDREALGRNGPDAPARPGCGRLVEDFLAETARAAKEKNGYVGITRDELQASRRDH